MTGVIHRTLNRAEARVLVAEVKNDAAALWRKLLVLYDGQAHLALGYASWGEFYEEEFGQSARTGYRLLEAARVVDQLPSDTRVTQNVARELAKADDPAETWENVVELHGPEPTAAQARVAVQELKKTGKRKRKKPEKSWLQRLRRLDDGLAYVLHHRPPDEARTRQALLALDRIRVRLEGHLVALGNADAQARVDAEPLHVAEALIYDPYGDGA